MIAAPAVVIGRSVVVSSALAVGIGQLAVGLTGLAEEAGPEAGALNMADTNAVPVAHTGTTVALAKATRNQSYGAPRLPIPTG